MPYKPVLRKVFRSDYTATHLTEEDACFHWRIYNSNRVFKDVSRNKIIWDFKITPEDIKKYPNFAKLKKKAIDALAHEMAAIFNTPERKASLQSYVWVLMPSSKAKDDPNHDDRLMQLLRRVESLLDINLHLCEPFSLQKSLASSHKSTGSERLTLDELKHLYQFDQAALPENPSQIIVFDDVLTKGTHFKAIKQKLISVYGDINIVGLFICQTQLVDE